MIDPKDDTPLKGNCAATRRAFLFGTSAAMVGTVMLPGLRGLNGEAVAAEVARYPRKLIGKMSQLAADKPIAFKYPDDGARSDGMLFKLGKPAGGGIGPDSDVVAFNRFCTHMGGDLEKTFQAKEQALGPCPLHQTSFDLTRHGIVISGHATESLPQILLEVDGDGIYAVGVMGLIHGRYDNLQS
ncbi:MAG: arsenate reductase (azurin) small subunit [Gammaproteobacteria bacterium]|jgi:arsenite oxidase small subunit|nr:arsenate reductase (azurin) small subunit [Gammaproteobacteria bacterium]